jgi:putative tryptophan/tyrosine transport system substrate-binding protein
MTRRELIALLGTTAAAWPLGARAQQNERMRRVGILMNASASDPEAQSHMEAFRQGIQALGWIEGRNIHLETRWGAADTVLIRQYAAELVTLSPELIVAAGGPQASAVHAVSQTIPVVFAQSMASAMSSRNPASTLGSLT